MVKQVVWSRRAHRERKKILEFWQLHNKSTTYSKKLNSLFKIAIKLIVEHPQIGKPTDIPNVRIKIVRHYLLIYEINGSRIDILSVWDTRQDPKKILKILR
ncbi:MAG: type II toxin-antitoxin system RelE/ParE family toxin [Cyclobacteriaceae bacterium]